jgi:hypothetical protein
MRYTTIKGVQNDVNITIYGNVSLICRIMKLGKCVRDLTYEVELSGAEILEKIHLSDEYKAKLNPENRYLITACDW